MSLDPTIEEAALAGRPTVRIERELAHPVDQVWRAVSEPDQLERWFVDRLGWAPKLGEDLDVGGQTVRVTRLQEPSVIAWEWGRERYRIELESVDDATTRLVFQHAFVDSAGTAEQHAMGWQVYLGRLATHLDGHFVEERDAHEQAVVLSHDGRPVVRFFRRFDVPAERVWNLAATPDGFSGWFPCTVAFDELAAGAAMSFDFGPDLQLTGEVRELEVPTRLSFDWGDDTIGLDVVALTSDAGPVTLFTFTHVMSEPADAIARTAAGWHVCLDAFARLLGNPKAAPVAAGRTPEWEARYDAYVARGYPSGAPIPTS
ncbi:MAG: hypothetical protein JWL76_1182 [Thermoleophilia bacterium]|nr:hypothetical protein [Thermoleophilia bacterium]